MGPGFEHGKSRKAPVQNVFKLESKFADFGGKFELDLSIHQPN